MYTVALPTVTVPTLWGLGEVTGQACVSDIARQAGIPPINTFTLPGPGPSGVPWPVISPTLAAGGISFTPSVS
ncbi:hypothetical protein [Paenibacillus contaminans]|uniref:hypothetical protein n=1 Tax=Paenibacillus contaminans TaxID=450362 RepID=UPI00307BD508